MKTFAIVRNFSLYTLAFAAFLLLGIGAAKADNIATVNNDQWQTQGMVGGAGGVEFNASAAAASSPGFGGAAFGPFADGGAGYAAADAAAAPGLSGGVGGSISGGTHIQTQVQVQAQDGTALAGDLIVFP